MKKFVLPFIICTAIFSGYASAADKQCPSNNAVYDAADNGEFIFAKDKGMYMIGTKEASLPSQDGKRYFKLVVAIPANDQVAKDPIQAAKSFIKDNAQSYVGSTSDFVNNTICVYKGTMNTFFNPVSPMLYAVSNND